MMPCIKPRITEREFTDQVIQLAKLRGWKTAHFRAARTSTGWRTPVQGDGAGFPDLVLCRVGRIVFAELKVGNNRVSPAQRAWLNALTSAGVQAFVWRPADWPEIERCLE